MREGTKMKEYLSWLHEWVVVGVFEVGRESAEVRGVLVGGCILLRGH